MTETKGTTEPRIFTPPLRRLTRRTSLGFEVCEWAEDVLSWKPMPWQRWLLIHAMEKLPNGALRFPMVLFMVARQNGKSTVCSVLALYWMSHGFPTILYSSDSLDVAKDQWEVITEMAYSNPEYFGPVKERRMNGHWATELPKLHASYTVISANRRGGRGKVADCVITDELREHMDFDAMAAVQSTTLTKPNAQHWLMSNAGDYRSVVLNHYRALGIAGSDPELFFAEWSAHTECELDDVEAIAQANPGLGYTIRLRAILKLATGIASVYRTENLCQGVTSLNAAIDPQAWNNCYDPATLEGHRSRIAVCLDVSLDLRHATLVAAAALPDGRVRVEIVRTWENTNDVRNEIQDILQQVQPRTFGWFSAGPSKSIATDLKALPHQIEITGTTVSRYCMEYSELVSASKIAHSGDDVLTTQCLGVAKLKVGSAWVFTNRIGWADAAYAAAGAVGLARQIPQSTPLRMISPRTDINK